MGMLAGLVDSLSFTAPLHVKVAEPLLGAVHKGCQLLVFLYVGISLYIGDSWAYTEAPVGVVNAWPEGGDWRAHADLFPNVASLPHCTDDRFSYAYDENFVMDNPECLKLHPYEVTTKAKERVSFVTGYIEMREVAWPTATEGGSGEADVMQSAMCTARGGNKTVTDGQAICVSQRTVYPLGIELMRMALEHAFMPGSDESVFAHLSGGSNIAVGEAGAVTTYLRAANGTVVEMIASGGSISNSLAGWLALADVSLDQPNLNLTADYRDPTKFPTFRTAGVSLDVSIFFDNRDPQTRKPAYDSRDVFAEVTVSASRNVWAGTGPSVHYEAYPETDPVTGKEIYDKVYRYRQGVIFTFRTAGLMYIMNWQFVLNVLIAGLVMLKLADVITFTYATMLHPKASVIRNATTKVFNVRKRFAEIGMKGALAARQFDILDDNGDQTVDFTDLVGSYARIDGVTFEQAFAIAHLVMEAASVETSEMKKARAKLGVSASAEPNEGGSADDGSVLFGDAGAGIDFGKFFLAQEGGSMIPWAKFLLVAPAAAVALTDKASAERKAACREAFENKRAGQKSKSSPPPVAQPLAA